MGFCLIETKVALLRFGIEDCAWVLKTSVLLQLFRSVTSLPLLGGRRKAHDFVSGVSQLLVILLNKM